LRCFSTRDNNLLVNAFKTYVRPIVEYNSVIWSPHLKRDIDNIVKVQKALYQKTRWNDNSVVCSAHPHIKSPKP